MNKEEAIKYLRMATDEAGNEEFSDEYKEMCRMSINALEKQIQKNWIAEYMGDGDFAWKCPICKDMFMLLDGTPQDNNYNYCPNCGQSMAEQLKR